MNAINGGARHQEYLQKAQLIEASKFNWLAQVISITASATGRVSVAILIGRIMGPSKWRRLLLYFLSITSLVFACVATIISFVQCSPSRALWEDPLEKCWDPKRAVDLYLSVAGMYGLSHAQQARLILCGGYATAVDLCLAIMPATFIWKLNLTLRKRIALSMLLGFGIL